MSTTALGKYELVASPWRCGACRQGVHDTCERIAHLRDERWTPCNCECQELPTEEEMPTLAESAQRRRSGDVVKSASRAKSRPCGCGCGDLTKGGVFLPGHDARHRSDLLSVINGEATEGKDLAIARMRELNWSRFLPDDLQAQPLVEILEASDDDATHEQETERTGSDAGDLAPMDPP